MPANLFAGYSSKNKVVDLSTPCEVILFRPPRRAEGKGVKRSEQSERSSQSLSTTKESSLRTAFSFSCIGDSFSLLRLGRLVCGRLSFACANLRACCAIVAENEFSPHRPSTPTISDCDNPHLVCSRLLPPVESQNGNMYLRRAENF